MDKKYIYTTVNMTLHLEKDLKFACEWGGHGGRKVVQNREESLNTSCGQMRLLTQEVG